MAYTRNYRTRIHQSLLVEIKAAKTAVTGVDTGFGILQDTILSKIISEKDKSIVKTKLYNQFFVYKANQLEGSSGNGELLDYTQVYVKLGLLLALFNKQFKTAESPYITFALDVGNNKYRTIDGHLSVDPQICLLPSTLQPLLDDQPGTDTPLVYDLLLNVDFVTKVLDDFIDSNGHVFMFDFFEQLFSEVERVTGGINQYELQYYESNSQLSIVDRNYLDPNPLRTYPVISVFGIDSIVKDVNLVTKISSKITSMVAISAQSSPFSSTEESTGFAKISKDLEQGVNNTIEDEGPEQAGIKLEAAQTSYQQALEKFQEDMITLLAHLGNIYGPPKILNLESAYGIAGIYQNFCNMAIGKKDDPDYSFILPFELSLGLHGMSGPKVLESFRITKDILPNTYGGSDNAKIAFVITGVEHRINKSEWTTNLRTQIYNVNDTGVLNSGEAYKSYWKIGGISNLGGGTRGTGDRFKGTKRLTLAETNAFFREVYKGIGVASPNASQMRFFEIWRQKEGASAAWNPFNTTQKATDSSFYNRITDTTGVQNYPNRQTGIDATVKTLKNGYYEALLKAILAIKDEASIKVAMGELHKSPWGTKFKPFPTNVLTFTSQKFTDLMWSDPIVKR